MARLRATSATSAGGVVVRTEAGRVQIVVGVRRRERGGHTWTLPKGRPIAGETLEQTALREVREESGLEVRIIRPIGPIEYSFVQSGTRIRKTVHYFLMEPIGGDLERHDTEFDSIRWIDMADVPTMLTFETERDLVDRAVASAGLADSGSTTSAATARGAAG